MNLRTLVPTLRQELLKRPIVFGAGAVLLIVVVATIFSLTRPDVEAVTYHELKRADFLISVVEGGTLEAVNEVVIRNEVEGTARVIFIIPEGSYAKKGDLLVELDSSSSQDALNQQQINVEKAQFALIQAQQQLEIQKSTADSETDAAALKVEFALSDFDKYEKGEAVQLRRNAQIEIATVDETLKINEERLEWSRKLYEKGYETKANLDKDALSVSQTRMKKEQAATTLDMLEKFDAPKKRRELEAALQEAKENLERVKLQGQSKMEQAKADVLTQQKTLELSLTKLERDKKQLLATKIYAPQDGLVVYSSGSGRFSSESMIEEGAVVRNRQELIKLPDVSEMKLTVKIHESHINNIRRVQPAYVVLDSMPDRRFRGVVAKVAPLPDSQARWGNPNLKVYATEIRITDKLPDIKPGVSARAEIVITNLIDALTVPIQAVTTRKGQPVAYLATTPPRPVTVTVGLYNNKSIEILSGLSAGDRVLLSPPFDTEEKDLAGSIIAQGESVPVADSNQVALATTPARAGRERGGAAPSDPGSGAGDRSRGSSGLGDLRDPGDGGRDPGSRDGSDVRPRREGGPREAGAEAPAAGGNRAGEDGAALAEGRQRGGREGGANRPNREEMLKQFDKNGDGELDDAERAAMRERFGGGQRRRGTNAPPAPPAAPGSPES